MTDIWHGGKGDRARKMDNKKYAENWEAIFRHGRRQPQLQDLGEKDLKFMTAEEYMCMDDKVNNSQAKEKIKEIA